MLVCRLKVTVPPSEIVSDLVNKVLFIAKHSVSRSKNSISAGDFVCCGEPRPGPTVRGGLQPKKGSPNSLRDVSESDIKLIDEMPDWIQRRGEGEDASAEECQECNEGAGLLLQFTNYC
jgi:hypothetical protein